jgi:cell division septation protein DedD
MKRIGNTIAVGLLLGFAQTNLAQAQRLPPPPNVPPVPSAPLPTAPITPIPVTPAPIPDVPINSPDDRVYTAPRVNPVSSGYRVIVDSDSPFLLQQVRSIQPDAFIQNFGGRRVIQAGLFTDQLKARQQVSRLASQGIDSRITGRSPEFGGSAERGYYAIVPGNQREVQEYRERAIRIGVTPGLLQVRDRPRGLHLAVGPFPNQREAEQVVRYLRDQGSLDARLFYDR